MFKKKNIYWNGQKYFIKEGRYYRTTHPHIRLAHDVWNYYNLNNKIEKNSGYCIHHINRDCFDDSIENLQKMTIGKHTSLHNKGNKYNFGNKNKFLVQRIKCYCRICNKEMVLLPSVYRKKIKKTGIYCSKSCANIGRYKM